MKQLRLPVVLLLLSGIFAGFLAGLYVGRNRAGQMIYLVPASTLPPTESVVAASEPETPTASEYAATAYPTSPDGKIDVNQADAIDLTLIPGIGDVLAQRIVAYREQNGPFQSLEELTNVDGIGQKKLNEIIKYAKVG